MKGFGCALIVAWAIACGGAQSAPADAPKCELSVVVTPDGTEWIGDVTVARRPGWPEDLSGQEVDLNINGQALPIVQADGDEIGGRLRHAPKRPGNVDVCIGFAQQAERCETVELTQSCIATVVRDDGALGVGE